MTIEAIKAAHQENKKAISSEDRDRTFKDPREQDASEFNLLLHGLENIIDRLDRIEAKIKCPSLP